MISPTIAKCDQVFVSRDDLNKYYCDKSSGHEGSCAGSEEAIERLKTHSKECDRRFWAGEGMCDECLEMTKEAEAYV